MSMKQERFRIVSVNDPAIDTERMPIEEMLKYIETRDEKLIAPYLRPGAQPTWFHIREIPRRLMTRFVQAAEAVESMRNEHAFRAGVTVVENVHQDDGAFLPSWEAPRNKDDVIPEKAVEERFSPCEVDEVGAVIWNHSFLARRMRRTYRLPHSSRETLSERAFRSAEQSPSSPAKNSSAASPAASEAPVEIETAKPETASDCGSATAATATETPSLDA